MEIKTATSAGFCFEVKRAVDTVYKQKKKKKKIYTYGPIIHNEVVVKELTQKGVTVIENIEELLTIPGTFLHWYAKTITKPGRKMGHVTLVNDDLEQLKQNIKQVNATVKVVAKK